MSASLPMGRVPADWLAPWSKSTGRAPLNLAGVGRSGRGYLLAGLLRADAAAPPVVALTPDEASAESLYADLCFHLGADPEAATLTAPVIRLPEESALPYDGVPVQPHIGQARMAALYRLLVAPEGLRAVVISIRALLRRGIPRAALQRHCEYLVAGEDSDRDGLIKRLVGAGYERVTQVEDPGHFAVRGFLIDLWPTTYHLPVRISFFGDEVEQMHYFDPATQLAPSRGKEHQLEELHIHPVREVLFDDETIPEATRRIRQRADELTYPSSLTRGYLEEIERRDAFYGIEALRPAFYPGAEGTFSFLPGGCRYYVDDPPAVEQAADDLWDLLKAKQESARSGLTFDPGEYFTSPDAVMGELWSTAPTLQSYRSVSPPGAHEAGLAGIGELRASLEARRGGEDMLRPLVDNLKQWRDAGRGVVMVCGDETRAERFVRLMADHHVEAHRVRGEGLARVGDLTKPGPAKNLVKPSVHVFVTVGQLTEGLVPAAVPVAFVAEADVFGEKKTSKRRVSAAAPFKTELSDLSEGDFVVHVDFGIGTYLGLKRIAAGGKEGDYLLCEYKGGDKLYLPATRIGALQRYMSPGGAKPRVDKMGSDAWQGRKAKVKKALTALAGELLNLYAARELRAGHAFTAPDVFYREFEAAFEFTETPDQLRAVQDTLADMQKPRPMDRLVCGDVGYGKTEVAMRAAFKAVEDGHQVAVLVPTTVLAQQHYRTFRRRFEHWPVQVGIMSRFQSAKEQSAMAKRAAEGSIDIVIGTHRLLQRDVKFRKLGLFVVDEEQRFGVKDKERIKRLAHDVDCLTLSATPIPRTLHMSMVGLRDLSVITTPPEDRLAIRTTVTRFNDQVIREAITAEMARGGQVYFIHNRVGSMPALKEYLTRIVPEARIGSAHGQMDGSTLERRMVEFVEGDYDVLLSTAIVESGLDIPSANTIIVNRADMFGMAQLYQLRGRVGRSRERAYAYLMVPAKLMLTPKASKRLAALSRFSDLGAGFQIASHDLELRGAGDLLGRKQHGSIAAVGFDLYTEILQEAVEELRGRDGKHQRPDPEMKMALSGLIPDSYVFEVGERLAIYRALSGAVSLPEVEAVHAAIEDRYGPLPESVQALVAITELKVRAKLLGATFVELARTRFVLTLAADTPIDNEKLGLLLYEQPRRFQLRKENEIVCRPSAGPPWEPVEDDGELVAFARRALQSLEGCAN